MNESRDLAVRQFVELENARKRIDALQTKLDNASAYGEYLRDKLRRCNLQIAELKKYKAECLRLAALLGHLGYDLKGNVCNQ